MRRPSPRLPVRGRPRAVAAGALAGLAVTAGALGWLRDSSVVAVERVAVVGATGPDAPRIASALEQAARDMTTLHVRHDALRDAVASYPTVADVEVSRDLPSGLRLRIVERRPVARVDVGGRQVPVAGDGTLLHGATAADQLPLLALEAAPAARVQDPAGRRLVAVIAAAPDPLRARAETVRAARGQGVVVSMREGPAVVFGGADRLRAKWASAARVLADPAAEGARTLDVRVPERPAAGGLPPLIEEEAEPSTST